ncbi:Os04g0489200 [Oryza sativa Japonica Group]|uniref:Os04g0489200 protein n=1 Tax=Oryza sativa subsp. japonica TaxID=39947 RepID=A0A0P0WBP8_ORYSJ|nr:hypothetical protein EE612_024102 [Oryza sativa]BAS89827.1 Os04g0489200 [Oryza sativa Japonica Group]
MRPPFRIRGVRRMSAALAAVNVAVAAAGAAAEWVGVTERCGRREEAAVGAAVALAAVRIVAMVGTARAQEVTALAVVSAGGSGGGGEGPTVEFAKRETRVGRSRSQALRP